MLKTHKYLASFFLSASLVAPAVIFAKPSPQEPPRYYDSERKEYHRWDDKEAAAWQRFLAEKHRKDHEFAKADKKEQQEYWAWRHSHPD
jgi:hypothetical protein